MISWDLIRGMLPQLVAIFAFSQLLPFLRVGLKPPIAGLVSIALALPFLGVEIKEDEVFVRCFQSLVAALTVALPLLLVAEYLSITMRSFEVLRGTMWAEQQQIIGDERGVSLDSLALLLLGTFCLQSPDKFEILRNLQSGLGHEPSYSSFGKLFENSLRVLFPVLALALVFEFSQGMLGRLAKKGSIDLLPLKLLAGVLLLAVYLPERLLNPQ